MPALPGKECVCRCAEAAGRSSLKSRSGCGARAEDQGIGGPRSWTAGSTAGGEGNLKVFAQQNHEDSMACVFLDEASNLCTIHETRPLVCRLF